MTLEALRCNVSLIISWNSSKKIEKSALGGRKITIIRSELNLSLKLYEIHSPLDRAMGDIDGDCKSICTNIPTPPPRPEVRGCRKRL